MTKIRKESNSQQWIRILVHQRGCCDLWQRYEKKAIHNIVYLPILVPLGVVTYDKDTKRKQFTTISSYKIRRPLVLWPMTKIRKESNSQPMRQMHARACRCCDLWQRYEKKAIHNTQSLSKYFAVGVVTYDKDTKRKQFTTLRSSWWTYHLVLWPMTKIQKESNSQRFAGTGTKGIFCAKTGGLNVEGIVLRVIFIKGLREWSGT